MISKESFCKALRLIREQENIDYAFSKALQTVGNGYIAFGSENKYREALLLLLREGVNDKYGYIDWWLYEASPGFEVWTDDGSKKWVLEQPVDLYEYIVTECQ